MDAVRAPWRAAGSPVAASSGAALLFWASGASGEAVSPGVTPSELERVLVWQPPRLEGWLLSAPSEEVSEPEREPRREEAEELLAGERALRGSGIFTVRAMRVAARKIVKFDRCLQL